LPEISGWKFIATVNIGAVGRGFRSEERERERKREREREQKLL